MRYHAHLVHALVALLTTAWLACGDDPKRPLGATCESDSQCESSLCVEGDGDDDPDEIDVARLTHLDADGDGKPDALESSLTDAGP